MKVLHVIDSGGMYGAEVMLLGLMEEQVRLGLEPLLASIGSRSVVEKPIETEARRRGLSVIPFRMVPGPNPAGAFEILSFAWREKVQLIHSHGYKGNILFGFLPRWFRRLPMIATVHGWTGTGEVSRMMLYEWLDGVSLARMDRVVVVNPLMKEHPRIKGRDKVAVEVVANGIGASSSEPLPLDSDIASFCRDGFIIGAVGRLSAEKGFDLLIEASAGLHAEGRNVRLVILGEGALRGELERQVRELGMEGRVLLPGFVPDARRYFPLFRLFVMSSLTEGLPMVLLEAMQAGVPVVATAVGGIPEVLDQGKYWVLTPVSAAAVKQGMREVMDAPDEAAERAARARHRVEERYSSRAMAANYRDIYRRVIG